MNKDDCQNIQAPFSDNYCRDWLLYHGGIFTLGVVILVLGLLGEEKTR